MLIRRVSLKTSKEKICLDKIATINLVAININHYVYSIQRVLRKWKKSLNYREDFVTMRNKVYRKKINSLLNPVYSVCFAIIVFIPMVYSKRRYQNFPRGYLSNIQR